MAEEYNFSHYNPNKKQGSMLVVMALSLLIALACSSFIYIPKNITLQFIMFILSLFIRVFFVFTKVIPLKFSIRGKARTLVSKKLYKFLFLRVTLHPTKAPFRNFQAKTFFEDKVAIHF